MSASSETATLGGGCFWCVEAVFELLKGVQKVESGYMGGSVDNPTYEQVCRGSTGHAEVVQIVFDPEVISFRLILEVFFTTHNPTTLNRQGADIGTQYRSAIFYRDAEQQRIARKLVQELQADPKEPLHIVTEIVPLAKFYRAEDYHQGYFRQHPGQGYCEAVIPPKLAKLRQNFSALLGRTS